MRDFFVIIIIAFIVNLIFLSVGYGQNPNNVNIQAIVPLTEENRQVSQGFETNSFNGSKFKENKFLYYFQKSIEQKDDNFDKQTWHDKIASYAFIIITLIVLAVIFLGLIHLFDKYIISHYKNEKK